MKITYHATIFSILCALVCGTPMNGTPASQNGNFEFRGLQKNVKCSNRYVYSKDELNEKGRYACETRMKLESNGRLRQMLAFINPLGEVKLYRGGAFKPDSEDAVLYRLSLNRFKGYNPIERYVVVSWTRNTKRCSVLGSVMTITHRRMAVCEETDETP